MSEWPMVKLGNVIKVVDTTEYIEHPTEETFITLKMHGNGAVKRNIGDGKTPKPFRGFRAKAGQFIYSRIDARNGAFGLIPAELNNAVVSKDFPLYNIDEAKIIPSLLVKICTSDQFINQIKSLSNGATNRQRIKEEILENLTIPLPPLDEQKRIAEVLSMMANMIDLAKSEIFKMQSLTSELLRQLICNSFEKKSLGAITLSKPDYGISQSSMPYNPSIGRYVRITDINEFGELQDKTVSPQQGKTALPTKKLLQPGDLIIARSGATIGKTYLHYHNEIPHWFAGYLIRFAIDPKIINPEIVFDYTKTNEYYGWIDSRKQTVAQPNISAQTYQELQIPIPTQDDQKKYLQKRQEIYATTKLLRHKLNLLQELQNSLSARAFAGLL